MEALLQWGLNNGMSTVSYCSRGLSVVASIFFATCILSATCSLGATCSLCATQEGCRIIPRNLHICMLQFLIWLVLSRPLKRAAKFMFSLVSPSYVLAACLRSVFFATPILRKMCWYHFLTLAYILYVLDQCIITVFLQNFAGLHFSFLKGVNKRGGGEIPLLYSFW